MNLQKIGGCAVLVLALIYVAGIVLNFTLLDLSAIADPVARAVFQVEHRALMSAFILTMYVGFGSLVVVAALAIHERFSSLSPQLVLVATVFALVWATLLIGSGIVFHVGLSAVADLLARDRSGAASLMQVVEIVHQGLGCTAEIPGGLWILLLGISGIRSGMFPKALAWTAIVVGASGLLSVVSALFVPAVAIYALLSIVWFVWMGLLLHRPATQNS